MKRSLAFALCLLLPSSLALADGEGPTRKMTGPESAAFKALASAFQSALPKTPANYALAIRFGTDTGEFLLPEAIKADQMARMSFTATYTLSPDFQSGQQHASFADRAKGTPDANAAMQNADQGLPAKELTVRAFINQEVNLNDTAAPYKLEGFPLAFEQNDGCKDFGTTCITVFLGTFDTEKRISGYTRYNLRDANLGVPTKARGLAIVVGGPKERAQSVRDFLRQVDLAKLRSLLP